MKHGYYDIFVRTCAKNPSRIAVRHYDNGVYKNYTYSELYGVCEYISQNLQQLVCGKGIIGVVSKRNVIIPCVIAAAHKCSTSFMFLDPSQDVEAIANQIACKILITIKEFEKDAPSELFGKQPDISVTVFNLTVNFYDLHQSGSQHSYRQVLVHSYIAMTSGSTGEPKHIQVPVTCLQPNIDDLTKMFEISPQDVIYFSTPLTFDPSMVEILLACLNGASLLIAPERIDVLFPEKSENAITFWQTTPSKFFQYSNADIKNKILSANSPLKMLALGGEPLNGVKRLKELKDPMNRTRIFTLYGVTEMSCWACVAELDLSRTLNDREIPLGECLSETQIMVERPHQEEKDTGKIILGLDISSHEMSRLPPGSESRFAPRRTVKKLVSKTRKCIILNKLTGTEEENSLKFVDTGDIGEVRSGTTYYRGRKDDIIKRFGHKVNLQTIENTIMQCPKVKTCSCVWLPKPMLLVVYFSSETLSSQELSDFLKCKLDEKHWPDRTIKVDNLPTNPHGKISKRMLTQLFEKSSQVSRTLDSLRVMFMKELKMLLGIHSTYEDIKYKDFFAIGGTSFLAVSMCNRLSLINPQFGKFILPYLVSPRKTIDEILQLAFQELVFEEKKPRKRLKRSNADSLVSAARSVRKASDSPAPHAPVEFVVLWSYDTGKCVDASPTLYQHELNLYVTVGSHSGKVVTIDARSGVTTGVVRVKSRVEAAVCCSAEAPLSAPCGMVGAYDGTLVCFTLDAGNELWRTNVGSMIKSKGVCCNGLLYVASYDGNVRCIDVLTGETKHTIKVSEQAISADLVLAKHEYILLGTLSGECACVHAASVTVAWRGVLGSPVFASPVLYDGDKYVVFAEVGGVIHCRTVEKGIRIWKYQGAKGNIFSSINIKEIDKLTWQMVFGCHDSNVYSIIVKNFQPTLQWKALLKSPVYSTPTNMSDKLILAISNNGVLCVLESATGTVISEYALPNESFSTPAVYNDYIFIGCRNDHLYSLKYILNA